MRIDDSIVFMVNALTWVIFFDVFYYCNFADVNIFDKIIQPCKLRMKHEQVQSNE